MTSLRNMEEWDVYMGIDDFESATEREGRMYRELQALKQARIERMRRIAPKGTVFPKKLMKAKRRVV